MDGCTAQGGSEADEGVSGEAESGAEEVEVEVGVHRATPAHSRSTLRHALVALGTACALLLMPVVAQNLTRQRPIQWTTIDGISGSILGVLLEEDTTYSPGYSDSRWRSLRIGMTESEVHEILGPPQRRWPVDLDRDGVKGTFGERWSFSPGDTHYRIRVVLFTDNRVVAIDSGFYLD